MKKFFLFLSTIFIFTVICIYFTEKTYLSFIQNTVHNTYFKQKNAKLILSWDKLPYPCTYRIDTFYKNTSILKETEEYHLISSHYTRENSSEIPSGSIPFFYSISAYGMFGFLGEYISKIPSPNYPVPVVPVSILHYTKNNPASLMPFLVWHTVPRAVCYELELLSAVPENEGGLDLSQKYHLFSTKKIYTNGFQADLRPYADEKEIYFRVRALNLQKEAIGFFSKAEKIYLDPKQPLPQKPLINDFEHMPAVEMPLYPVYNWIPMHDTLRYEVELLAKMPQKENNTTPSAERLWYGKSDNIFSIYDEYARPYPGTYYWRVRGIDENNNTVGVYSDTATFTVKEQEKRIFAATLGDSITHGGGAVSYSPFNQEYNYTTYLDFPVLNLGRSGDTVHTTMLRFEEDVLYYKPYNLLILAGSNDLRADTTATEIINDLEIIRVKCEQNDIRPIFLTLMPLNPKNILKVFHSESDPNWHLKLRTVNEYIRKQKYYIELEPYFYDAMGEVMAEEFAIDGLHPDIRGKMLIGEIINANKKILRNVEN